MKKFWVAFLLIALSLCVFAGCNPDAEKIDWVNVKLGHILPEPQSELMEIVSNDEDDLLVYIHNISQNQFLEYQRWCEQNKGFSIDTESLGSSFYGYNQDGYYLSLYYNDSQDEMHITLTAPIPMEAYVLPEFAIAAGLPVPESKVGHFVWQYEDNFLLYVGETTKDAYALYKEACITAGFTDDPYEYDTVYSATNKGGFKVSLNYKGFNTFTLEFDGSKSENNTSIDQETGNTNEDYTINYTDASSFETALNNGVKVKGNIVKFEVAAYKPNSALGVNCWAGEHLNFISEDELDVAAGDTIVAYISEEPSKTLGSWKIPYIALAINDAKTGATTPSQPENITPESPNTLGAPDDWTNLLEKHYEDVKKQFENAGFTNIVCVAHEIDYNEDNTFEGSVVNIAIGENGEICTFKKGDQWPKNTKVRIDYRIKPAEAEKPDTTKIVLPQDGTKLSKDFDFESSKTIYYVNVDGTKNKPLIQTWGKATVTDGVAEYLDYLENLGFSVTITDSSHREPYSNFHLYETNFKVANSSVSWTMYLCIQKEKYVEYELDIHKN